MVLNITKEEKQNNKNHFIAKTPQLYEGFLTMHHFKLKTIKGTGCWRNNVGLFILCPTWWGRCVALRHSNWRSWWAQRVHSLMFRLVSSVIKLILWQRNQLQIFARNPEQSTSNLKKNRMLNSADGPESAVTPPARAVEMWETTQTPDKPGSDRCKIETAVFIESSREDRRPSSRSGYDSRVLGRFSCWKYV